ncbi:MAG: PKD domain-containing protein [Bacteroidales bacterium]|nr:PKD domain-containing protein [Bacteroidales bacterium]
MKALKTILITAITTAMALDAIAQNIDISPVKGLFNNNSVINPIVVDSTLYFASDAKSNFAVNYIDNEGNHLYRIYKVRLRNQKPYGQPKPYFKYCNKPYSQVAITFFDHRPWVTQNNIKESTDGICPLGIFEFRDENQKDDGNSAIMQPKGRNAGYATYSNDGTLMIFASDMPGGEGGTDLYYREKVDGFWSQPQNMGSVINTEKTETTPFIHSSGKIFFASNGRADSKRLDIYYTYKTETGFAEPVRFDTSINSLYDDYGIYYSDDEEWGFVTSNRHGKDKLYYFKQKFPEFPDPQEYTEPNYCFTLYEETADNYDQTEFSFKWDFGDGTTADGTEVDHCFPGAGVYNVSLTVFDKLTKDELFKIAEYPLDLSAPDQIEIIGPRKAYVGDELTFAANGEGIKTFTPTYYYWDFGRKNRKKGRTAKVSFRRPGTYVIKCGTIADEDSSIKLCNMIEVVVEKRTTKR